MTQQDVQEEHQTALIYHLGCELSAINETPIFLCFKGNRMY